VLLTGISLWCATASAQTRQDTNVEFGAGYSLLYAEGSLPIGFAFTVGREVRRGFVLVGEAAGNYKFTWFSPQRVVVAVSHALTGGLRLTHRAGGASPFFQILAGPLWESGSGPSETDAGVQPGVGVDFRVSDRRALRLQGDYRGVFGSPSHAHEYRFIVGVVARSVR
jgi:hypothetical protein